MAFIQLPPTWAVNWQLVSKLGSGGYSTVWRAIRRDQPSIEAAIKIISIPNDQSELDELRSMKLDASKSQAYYDKLAKQYVSEIVVMENLKGSQNIVNIEDYCVMRRPGGIGNLIYIRMELLTPLSSVLKNRYMTESESIQLGMDMCAALETCHRINILHRDIKPANIFVSAKRPGQVTYKLGDFGIARSILSGGMSIKGTPGYMAPEAFLGKEYDRRADLYSLGITLYQLLNMNRYPLMGDDISAQGKEQAISRRMQGERLPPPSNASPAMAQMILKACAYQPEHRFQSAAEMRQALIRVKNGEAAVQTRMPTTVVDAGGDHTAGEDDIRRKNKPQPAPTPQKPEDKKKQIWLYPVALLVLVLIGGIIKAGFFPDSDVQKNVTTTSITSASQTADDLTDGGATGAEDIPKGKDTIEATAHAVPEIQETSAPAESKPMDTEGQDWVATPTPTPELTELPTPTPTPELTESPTPSLPSEEASGAEDVSESEIEGKVKLADTIEYHQGIATISWKANGASSAVQVYGKVVNHGSSEQAMMLLGEADGESLDTDMLVPGVSYQITITDMAFNILARGVREIPEAPDFEDGKLKASSVRINSETRMYDRKAKDMRRVYTLSAKTIAEKTADESAYFGVKYQMSIPRLATVRHFFVTIVFESPDGFLYVDRAKEVNFRNETDGYQTWWWSLAGYHFFESLYSTTGSIPVGTYSVHLYWEGMHVNTTEFMVGE